MPPVPYAPPKVSLGQTVLFRTSPSDDPTPAIVTVVGEQVISVTCIVPNAKSVFPRTTVRHISDPGVQSMVVHCDGVWDHTEEYKQLVYLLERDKAIPAKK